MTDKEKIRNEVERLRILHQMRYQQFDANSSMSLVECGKRNLCNELLSFIDSMQEEPVSEDLEEAANNALERLLDKYDLVETGSCLEMFKLGAEWQKEQMMEKAVDGKVLVNGMGNPILHLWDKGRHLIDKKVKIIVIKED